MNCSVRPARLACGFAALAALGVFATSAIAAPPKITRLSVRGFQAGGTTRVAVQGTNFGAVPKLVLGAPVKEQKLLGKSTATTAEFEVTLDAAVPAGVYHLRLRTADGLSPAELVTIDGLPQQPAAPTVTELKQLPAAVHGLLSGSAVQETNFTGRKGETITVDVLAARFGSKLRPVVHLYDAEKRQLAWSPPQTALSGDARLTAMLPADGKYAIAVHDLAYAAATPGHYRLAVGSFDYVDQVFPPVTARGASPSLELIGRFGKRNSAELSATAAGRVTADDKSPLGDDRPLPWPEQAAPIGLRPHVQLSSLPELVESELPAESRKLPSAPVAVSGRLLQPREVDLYRLELIANEKVQIEVFADRYGSPLDATLEVRNETGVRLSQADDVVGPDPRLEYVSSKNDEVLLAVGDALHRGGENCVYRLVVTKLDDAQPRADFRLTVADETHNVPSGGGKVFRVAVARTGYDGPIRITVDGLPPGLTAAPVEIPAQADGALIELRQTGKQSGESYSVSVVGSSVGAKPEIVRRAASSVHPLARLQPWLAGESAAATMETAVPLAAEWDVTKSDDAGKLYLGTDEKLSVRLKRDPQTTGSVRLSLLTTQPVPGGNAQQAAQQTLRGVAATVDVKPDAKKETAEFAIRIPADLRQTEYDVALKAELLSADGKTIVGEAYTPPRRFRAAVPIEVVAEAVKPVTPAKSGPTAVALTGELKRLKNYAGDVTLSLAGLPKEATSVQPVVLKAKDAQFKIEFRLPPTFAAERIEGVKLVAAITPDNRRANDAGSTTVNVPPIAFTKLPAAPAAATKPVAEKQPAAKKPAK